MKYEVTIYELGRIIKTLDEKYKLNILIKKNLTGGWLTINGEMKLEVLPVLGGGCHGKDINILELRLLTDNNEGAIVKLTGSKIKKFNVSIAAGKYKEISMNSITLNSVKTNNSECKLRIDEDIIITIQENCEIVSEIFNKCLCS